MKFNDKIAQRIIATGITLSAFALIFTLFMSTVGAATAASPSKTTFDFPDELSREDVNNLSVASNTNGRFMMQFEAVYENDDDVIRFYNVVWDTSTGESKLYYGSTYMGAMKAAGNSFNLPSNPLD